jgi:hypothetical protein
MLKEIEGIEFRPHHSGFEGHWQAVVTCKDGTKVSIIQCSPDRPTYMISGHEFHHEIFPGEDRGCFYGTMHGEDRFEVWDRSEEDVVGWQTAKQVVATIMKHGGIA